MDRFIRVRSLFDAGLEAKSRLALPVEVNFLREPLIYFAQNKSEDP